VLTVADHSHIRARPEGAHQKKGDGLPPSAKRVSVLTHMRIEETREAMKRLVEMAGEAGVTLCFNAEETEKHGLKAGPGVQVDERIGTEEQLCVVLGGDGTILRALRLYAGTRVPVFAVNFGEIGFLATVEPQEMGEGIARAFEGRFELLAYTLDGEEVGSVRCDGLVLATPAGSTGYNLANGGPVMAWGVEGFVVSFIAPHSLTARALVAAPGDPITIHNRSREALDVAVDGRPVCDLAPDARIRARFVDEVGTIAQLPGSSFYRRLREKFGRLAR
jgi:NAD+ kinase